MGRVLKFAIFAHFWGSCALGQDTGAGFDAAVLREFFTDLRESAGEEDAEVAKDVDALGSEQFGVREAAEWRLTRRLWVSIDDLQKFSSEDADFEIRTRLRKIAARRVGFVTSLLVGVREQGVENFAGDLFALADSLPAADPIVGELARLIESDDSGLGAKAYRKNLAHKHLRMRRAAVRGLGKTGGDNGDQFKKLLTDGNERVRLEAAFALVRSGDQRGIEEIVRLLGATSDKDTRVIVQSLLAAVAQREVAAFAETKADAAGAAVKWDRWRREELKGRLPDHVAGIDDSVLYAGTNIRTDRDSYKVLQPIIVNFSGMPGNPYDWITIVDRDSPATSYKEYHYTDERKRGQLKFNGLPAGIYEVRGYHNWPDGGYEIRARRGITVK